MKYCVSHITQVIFITIIQLRSCRQNTECHDNTTCQLESQSAFIANGNVHNDSSNIQSNSDKNLEEHKTNGDKDQPCLQYIIIDMAPVTFIDSCGSKMLERVRILT